MDTEKIVLENAQEEKEFVRWISTEEKVDTPVLRVLLLEPGEAPVVATIPDCREARCALVCGAMSSLLLEERDALLVFNAHGREKGFPANRYANHKAEIIYGPAILFGFMRDASGPKLVNLTEKQIAQYRKRFKKLIRAK